MSTTLRRRRNEDADRDGCIRDLCVALAHRWEPGHLFVVLTAYFDESGTHGGSEVAVMAGFMTEAKDWRNFEKRTEKLFGRYKVDIFHAIDVRRTDGAFDGWKLDKKADFLDEFEKIINDRLRLGIVVTLRTGDYRYYCGLSRQKGSRPETAYTVLFRGALSTTIDNVSRVFPNLHAEPKLNVVVEGGSKNASDALSTYDHFKRTADPPSKALSGLTFHEKDDCRPLAAADFLAYSVFRDETAAQPTNRAKELFCDRWGRHPDIRRVRLTRGVLDGLHAQAVAIGRLPIAGLRSPLVERPPK